MVKLCGTRRFDLGRSSLEALFFLVPAKSLDCEKASETTQASGWDASSVGNVISSPTTSRTNSKYESLKESDALMRGFITGLRLLLGFGGAFFYGK